MTQKEILQSDLKRLSEKLQSLLTEIPKKEDEFNKQMLQLKLEIKWYNGELKRTKKEIEKIETQIKTIN